MQNYFGEIHEGKYVDEILRAYFPDLHKGVFFDVGAFEPIRISNSHHFHLDGWQVHAFEANPAKISSLKEHRSYVYNYAITDSDSNEPLPFQNVYLPGDWTASYSAIEVKEEYKQIFGWNPSYRWRLFLFPKKPSKPS
jgi:hypothetical protein